VGVAAARFIMPVFLIMLHALGIRETLDRRVSQLGSACFRIDKYSIFKCRHFSEDDESFEVVTPLSRYSITVE
jgi:hypothetical protein